MSNIQLLQRYRIDRSWGATLTGPERLVILVLKGHDSHEVSFAISKVDAMLIASQLTAAATEVQAEGS